MHPGLEQYERYIPVHLRVQRRGKVSITVYLQKWAPIKTHKNPVLAYHQARN